MTTTKIDNPNYWDIVTHGGLEQTEKNYPCDVIIEGGDYLDENGNIINQWQWRRILPNLKLGKLETGTGDFYKCDKTYCKIIRYKNNEAFVKKVELVKKVKVNFPRNSFTDDCIF